MFERLEELIGNNNIEKLHNKTVAIIGLGGVGGYTIETLVRNGIENIIIVDNDVVDITNKNRQIIALDSTINKSKVQIFKERINDINKKCNVIALNIFLNEETKKELFKYNIDYLVDACDTISTKIMLIRECLNRNIKFISSMGTGNKLDPTKLKVLELKKTSYDPLAKVIRREINKLNINDRIMVLSSTEEPIKTNVRTPGSYSVVPNIAGILIADYIIKDVIDKT
ncbi:MAG: tRNA threonylcarbamoyladenosine dehydratase [Bacilli bacterium]|nr:tRNA threonylcarbamoyladenosine dehydratase [Bacilli bacterium]